MANDTINNINIQMDQQQQQQPTVRRTSFSQPKPKVLRPFNTSEVKILLLENVNETAVKAFKKQGYQVCIIEKLGGGGYHLLTSQV